MNVLLTPTAFFGLLAISFIICGAVIVLYPFLVRYLRDRDDLASVQSAHERVTPRLGGVGILTSSLIALLLLVPDDKAQFFALFSLTLTPVFAAGFAEDMGWRVSANHRLGAAAASAGLVMVLLKLWFPLTGLLWIDLLLGFTPFAIALTLLWATGICHAFNLIDGVNGLAGATGLLIAAGIAVVADNAGAHGFATVAFALVPALIGFLMFNWPLGRIFMGDAGAYTLGHVLVWLAIGLAWHNADTSIVAMALMFFWPVADTLLAIARRRRAGRRYNTPDRLHFHQLVMRALMLISHGRMSKGVANSATTLVLLPFVAAPIFAAVYLWDRPLAALIAWVVFGVLFVTSYMGGIRSVRGARWRKAARRLAKQSGRPHGQFVEVASLTTTMVGHPENTGPDDNQSSISRSNRRPQII
ncbi:MAG: MraY family glycosyltransferase [Paracoccaceae bacterium]